MDDLRCRFYRVVYLDQKIAAFGSSYRFAYTCKKVLKAVILAIQEKQQIVI